MIINNGNKIRNNFLLSLIVKYSGEKKNKTDLLEHSFCQASWYLDGSDFCVGLSRSAASMNYEEKKTKNKK